VSRTYELLKREVGPRAKAAASSSGAGGGGGKGKEGEAPGAAPPASVSVSVSADAARALHVLPNELLEVAAPILRDLCAAAKRGERAGGGLGTPAPALAPSRRCAEAYAACLALLARGRQGRDGSSGGGVSCAEVEGFLRDVEERLGPLG
jgi:hypothetical protein